MLRREKADRAIVPELPAKIEFAESCNLTREQASLYQAVVDELLPDIEGEDDDQAYRGKVLRAILRLKQVCDHPALFLGDGSALRGRSGKLERLEEVIDNVLGNGERALVFTQFTEWGERLVPHLRARSGERCCTSMAGCRAACETPRSARFEDRVGADLRPLAQGRRQGPQPRRREPRAPLTTAGGTPPSRTRRRIVRTGSARRATCRCARSLRRARSRRRSPTCSPRSATLPHGSSARGERAFTELTTDELRTVLALGADAVAEDRA